MKCNLAFPTYTNCDNPDIIDFAIEISGLTIYEILDINSTTSQVSGVTFLGTTAIDGLNIDEDLLTQNIEISFLSFQTECEKTIINKAINYEADDNFQTSTVFYSNCFFIQ